MPLTDDEVKEVNEYFQRKLRKCSPADQGDMAKMANELVKCIGEELKNDGMTADLTKFRDYITVDKGLDEDKEATYMADAMNTRPALKALVDSKLGR
jgi:hypothetical protein